ncbi:transmembrane protein 180-like [Dendronephthya gigantea]|uniref:transmembrane protein 180-like n=1 Tax=Dendronephthya gigantea TaxID=151771 RepID=UPI00106CEBDE|nr:transmembrane protein 180-like [Dendronephthya gigantea]
MEPMEVVRISYGSIALFWSILHNVFLLYYVEIFVSVYKIDKTSFWIGEAVFLVWNSLNDPLFGWISDHGSLENNIHVGSIEIVRKRIRALMKFSPVFVLGFLSFWFSWLQPSLQFVICLCIYDAFLTLIDLNHSALLADLALSEEERTKLNSYSSFFSAIGSTSVFISYYFWDKEFIITFQTFCVCLAIFSFLGFVLSTSTLKHYFEKTSRSSVLTSTNERHEVATRYNSSSLALKRYVKQLLGHKNFWWFTAMNLIQVFHCHFNSNFFPLFLDKLLGHTLSPKSAAFLLGLSFVTPHINNLYFLTLCRRFGAYIVIRWLFYVKLALSLVMLMLGPDYTALLCIFIASNRVFTEGTCKLLNLVISDLVDEDYVIHHRKQSISALVFGTSALLSKPGQTLAPLLGTWLLAKQTGYSIFYSDEVSETHNSDLFLDEKNFHDRTGNDVKYGCFQVLVYVPIVCAILQIIFWSRFKLHGRRLKVVTSQRIGAEIGGAV